MRDFETRDVGRKRVPQSRSRLSRVQIPIIMEAENGKYIFGVVKVGERGQIVIPKEAREVYGIKAGDSLLVLGDMKGMAVIKTEIFQDKIDEMLGGN